MRSDAGKSNEIGDDKNFGMQSGRSLNPFLLRDRCCRTSIVIIIILAVFIATQAHMIRAIKQRDVVLTRFLIIHPWFNKKLKNIIWDKIIYEFQSLSSAQTLSLPSHRNRIATTQLIIQVKPSHRRPAWHSTHSIHYKSIARIAQKNFSLFVWDWDLTWLEARDQRLDIMAWTIKIYSCPWYILNFSTQTQLYTEENKKKKYTQERKKYNKILNIINILHHSPFSVLFCSVWSVCSVRL